MDNWNWNWSTNCSPSFILKNQTTQMANPKKRWPSNPSLSMVQVQNAMNFRLLVPSRGPPRALRRLGEWWLLRPRVRGAWCASRHCDTEFLKLPRLSDWYPKIIENPMIRIFQMLRIINSRPKPHCLTYPYPLCAGSSPLLMVKFQHVFTNCLVTCRYSNPTFIKKRKVGPPVAE